MRREKTTEESPALIAGELFGPLSENTPRPVVAIAAAAHRATLQTVAAASSAGIAEFILFDEQELIEQYAAEAGISLEGVTIRECPDEDAAARQAAATVAAGEAGVLMKGRVHTSEFSRSFLDRQLQLIPEGGLVSHTALFTIPDYHKPFLFTDGAINIAPDYERKCLILKNVLSVAAALGIKEPRTALITPVETVSPRIPSTVDAEKIARLQQKGYFGPGYIEGPMALDAALSAEAAAIKGITGNVPGNPDILLMPNLDCGNAVYKAFTLQPGTRSAGILAGLRVPVVLTSRADSELTRFLSLYMALAVSERTA